MGICYSEKKNKGIVKRNGTQRSVLGLNENKQTKTQPTIGISENSTEGSILGSNKRLLKEKVERGEVKFPTKKGNFSNEVVFGTNIRKRTPSSKEITVNSDMFINLNIDNIKQQYTILKKIGQGGYGTVWKVQQNKTQLIRAMKKINKVKNNREKIKEIVNEINTLKKLDHPNIVKIFEFFEEIDGFYLITEYCNGGELLKVIEEQGLLNEKVVANIMYQVFSGVSYLHNTFGIIHRDLKLENILIESRDQVTGFYSVKLIDFGTATKFTKNQTMKKIIGSAYYIAPEVLNKKYNEKCDIWSLGVMLYFLLTGFPPFGGFNEKEIHEKIMNKAFDFPINSFEITKEGRDLLKRCFETDIDKRISAREALDHPWFKIFRVDEYFSRISPHYLESTIHQLMSYSPKNKLQELAMAYLIHNFSNLDEVKRIGKVFAKIDKSHRGKLTLEELEYALNDYLVGDKNEQNKRIQAIFEHLDSDKNGFIEFEEFCRAGINKRAFLDDKILKFIFDFFDKNEKGEISYETFKDVFGLKDTDVEEEKMLNEMLKKIDIDGNGKISFEEFKKTMLEIMN